MTEREYREPVPPYVSYRSFCDALAHFRKNGVPKAIVPGSFGDSVAKTAAPALIATLRFLGLILVDDGPTLELNQLVKANDKKRKTIMKRIVKQNYSTILELDLKTIRPAKLKDAFKKYGAIGSVAEKCATFFSQIALDAGLKLSPQIQPGAKKARAKPKKKSTPAAKKPNKTPKIEVTLMGDETAKWLSKVKFKLHPMMLGLLRELPKPGSTLTARQKNSIKRYFESMLDILYRKESDD
ncbi:hypothetical protein ACFLXN_01030 [Chloroflexota bacterium]